MCVALRVNFILPAFALSFSRIAALCTWRLSSAAAHLRHCDRRIRRRGLTFVGKKRVTLVSPAVLSATFSPRPMSNLAATHRYDNISSCGTTRVLAGARNKHGGTCCRQPLNEHVLHARSENIRRVVSFFYLTRDLFLRITAAHLIYFSFFRVIILSSLYRGRSIFSAEFRKTLWLSDPIKRFMSRYFNGRDAENGLTGKMRNDTSIGTENGIPFTRAEYYSRIE